MRSTARNDVKSHTEDKNPKYRMVGKMKGNNFTDKVYLLFTTHHSLINNDTDFSRFTSLFSPKRTGATHLALCDSVGSYFRHWCAAFTLAEVLITLGIIGVVAAMTMPSLITNYQKKQTVTQLKKAYSELSQALKASEAEYGTMDSWDFSGYNQQNSAERDEDFTKHYILPNIKTMKVCSPSSNECWADDVLALNKTTKAPPQNGRDNSFVTASGYSVYYWPDTKGVWFFIDINGLKKPNIVGRDIFRFRLCIDDGNNAKNYALNPYGADRKLYYKNDLINGNSNGGCNKDNSSSYAGDTCAALIMYNNWEITKDYPW